MKNQRIMEFMVGLFVLGALASFFWMTFNVTANEGGNDSKIIKITATFNNVGSLKVKAPVVISGVRVGRISSINLDKNSLQAIVSINLNASIGIPNDSNAVIQTSGLVGEQYIALKPGGSDKDFVNGDQIKITQDALVIEELIGKFLTSMGSSSHDKP
ncbi:ABC-type organic solvent transporter [Gammaproteobacteria bacterium]|nr:ABC-type organic solvent transporter [Gammaproteobacteria bacterium]